MAKRKKKDGFSYYKDYGSSQVFRGSGGSQRRRRSDSVDDRMDAAASRARAARQPQPYEEVGGGDPCGDCNGSTDCNACAGVGSKTLSDGSVSRCVKCRWRIGKCYACRGTGKERPTQHRRDG